ncbi:MAG TPA: hypothetical protein PLG15_03695 [Candidatus Gastranaerophilaceae bacterium]|nr:hypothetical protein [Candidatus Gastranaerophilaceae bacterium]
MKVMFNCCPRPSVYTLFRGEGKKPETTTVVAQTTAAAPAAEQSKTDTVQITTKTTEKAPEVQPKQETEPKKCEGSDCKK